MATLFPILFIKAMRTAGIIPTNGPMRGIRLAKPAIIPIKIVSVKFAPKKLRSKSPAKDIAATLAADKNCPRR